MPVRYSVMLAGRKIGTVWLEPASHGTAEGPLGPMPAFKRLARLHRRVDAARDAYDELELATPEAALADEEAALAELSELPLTLQDEAGAPVGAAAVRLVRLTPPLVAVDW